MNKHVVPAVLVFAFTLDEPGHVGWEVKENCCLAGPSKLLQVNKTFAALLN